LPIQSRKVYYTTMTDLIFLHYEVALS
jgi:hypothetical protein